MSCTFCSDPGTHIAGHSMPITDLAGHARHNLKIMPYGDDDAFLAGLSVQCIDCNKRLMEITNKVNFCPMCGNKIKKMNADHLGNCVCFFCDKKITCPHCLIARPKLKFRQLKDQSLVCPCGRSFQESKSMEKPKSMDLISCKACNKSITRMFGNTNGGLCYLCEVNGR